MPQQLIKIGAANAGYGDTLFTISTKVNANFTEVYALANTATAAASGKQPLSSNLTALSNAGTITGIGTTAGTLAAGDDGRIVGAVQQGALSSALDTAFSSTRGSVLYRGSTGWVALAPGTSGNVLATGGAGGDPSWVAQASSGSGVSSAALDSAFGSAQGSILYRSASAWTTLTPGTAGYLLQTGGAGANPSWVAPPSATTNPSISVRQTVVAGPAAASAPSFLPPTSGSLTLTAQNVSSTVPLIVTAAQGGVTNATYTYTSNPSWTVPTNSTGYLFSNASTGATTVLTLAPIYQFGGTPSTANGQFTFDYQVMVGYLGNGTTAVATPLVCVGQATTSGSAVTSTTAYAYQGMYVGPVTTFAASTTYTFNHNIGVPVENLRPTLYARSPFTTGPWLPYAQAVSATGYPAVGLFGAASSLAIRVNTGSNGLNYDNGSNASVTATSGDFMVRVQRDW